MFFIDVPINIDEAVLKAMTAVRVTLGPMSLKRLSRAH